MRSIRRRSDHSRVHIPSSEFSLPQVQESIVRENSTGSSGLSKKRVRGRNKNKVVASLGKGEKMKAIFYNNRAAGENHKAFSRHLGTIIRMHQICPLNVASWRDITEEQKNDMWDAVLDKFEGDDLQYHKDDVLKHMRELWNKWRGWMHITFVKGKTPEEAMKIVPEGVYKDDWEWLIKKHFYTEKFKKVSSRNSKIRVNLTRPHRTGSKPIREIIYQMVLKSPLTKKVDRETMLKEENQLLKDRLNTLEDKFKKFEEMFLAQQNNVLPAASSHSTDGPTKLIIP